MSERSCDVDGCDRRHEAKGLCKLHYKREVRSRWPSETRVRRNLQKSCEWCAASFMTDKRGQLFCSHACAARARSTPPSTRVVFEDCRQCGGVFVKRRQAVYCSDECRRLAAYKPRPARPVPCEVCGDVVMAKQGVRRFCSQVCARQLESYKEARRRSRRRRRAALRGGRHERYTLAEIAERDGWKCGICGKRVGQSFDPNHGRAPTIDHIVPIADGGDDVKINVQLSHRSCNSRKSHTGPGQLRLVG